MSPLHVVIGILKGSGDKVLIACRPPTVVSPGLWEFPGGKVEPGESLEDALRREFMEEVGVTVLQVTPFLFLEKITEKHHLHLHSFIIHNSTGEPRGCENQEIRWVTIDALLNYKFPEANALIIQKLQEM